MRQRYQELDLSQVSTESVRDFWQKNPLCANGIPHPVGSPEFFEMYVAQRETIESIPWSYALHEYKYFTAKKTENRIR